MLFSKLALVTHHFRVLLIIWSSTGPHATWRRNWDVMHCVTNTQTPNRNVQP